MTTASTIAEAITRSISHTEIVAVTVPDLAGALAEVNTHAENYDSTEENDGSYDVWGTTEEGKEFRLRLIEESHSYDIITDSGMTKGLQAPNLAAALKEWGEAPASVTTAQEWIDWLDGLGGFGRISEDGREIARVES